MSVRLSRGWILALIFAWVASPVRADCPTAYEFVVIADDAGELTLVDPDFVRGRSIPSLGPDGRVAFTAWLDAGGRAVMVGDENVLVDRVRDRDADPASDWRWLDEVRFGGDIAFFDGELERDGAGFPALGAVNNARVVELVAVAAPDERFGSIADFDVSASGIVAFGASDRMLGGIVATARYRESPRVVASGEPSYGGVSIGDGDDVSYFLSTPAGLRLVAASGDIVAETDPETGLGPEPPISMGPGTGIAYVFAYADPTRPGYAAQRIRRYNPSTRTSSTLADSALGDFGRHADGVKVSLLDQTGLSGDYNAGWGGCVAFLGQGDEGRDTIFVADEDGVGIVVTEGAEIDGGFVGILDMGPMAVYATGQIAFWASLGTNRRAIVRADPIFGPRPDGGPGDSDAGVDPIDPVDPPGEESGGCLSVSATRADPSIALALVFALVALRRRARSKRRRGRASLVLLCAFALGCEECEEAPPVDAGTSADAGDAGDPGDGGDAGSDAGDASLDADPDARVDADIPARCPGPRVAAVSFRAIHGGQGCAVTTTGELRCWGSNFDGELGRGTTSAGHERAGVVDLASVEEVEASEGFTCARLAGGDVTCWGRNNLGQLGDGNRPTGSTVPLAMPSVRGATSLDSGRYAICAVRSGGPVCWGWDMMSNLTRPLVRPSPVAEMRFLAGATEVALGELAGCALAAGRVVCNGAEGALGPTSIDDAIAIGSGVRHFCAARAGGAITCWGQNFDGQLGDGTTTDNLTGVAVAGLTDAIAIEGGWGHTCALRDDASVWCWGANGTGQLGRGTVSDAEPVPAPVPDLAGVIAIDGDYDSMCAVTSAGDLLCWGHLDYGDARSVRLSDPTCVDLGP